MQLRLKLPMARKQQPRQSKSDFTVIAWSAGGSQALVSARWPLIRFSEEIPYEMFNFT